jgi:hypothetical protein
MTGGARDGDGGARDGDGGARDLAALGGCRHTRRMERTACDMRCATRLDLRIWVLPGMDAQLDGSGARFDGSGARFDTMEAQLDREQARFGGELMTTLFSPSPSLAFPPPRTSSGSGGAMQWSWA